MSMDMTYFDEMEARIPRGKVRTRFAPRPPAICTWQSAHRPLHLAHRPAPSGTFILRIEDTDQTRQVEGATEVIYRTLAECGLDHDGGPRRGRPGGPLYPDPAPGHLWKVRPAAGGKGTRLLLLL